MLFQAVKYKQKLHVAQGWHSITKVIFNRKKLMILYTPHYQ